MKKREQGKKSLGGDRPSDRIRHVRDDDGGEFVVTRRRRRVAELTYRLSPGAMAIDHTYVDPVLRGQGVAEQMVDAAVAWARAQERRIIPACPYVRVLFDRKKAKYGDVRALPE